MDSPSAIYEIRRVLIEKDDFVLAAHVNPDSDAIGSCLAMGLALKKLGKRVHVTVDHFHDKNRVIPGQELVWPDGAAEPECAVFIVLDCASADRVSDRYGLLKRAETVVFIDHHLSNDQSARRVYLDPDASSSCELVYRIISPIIEIDCGIASAIYAGLLTDTGGFRHACASAETMRAAGELMKLGVPFTSIYDELMRKHSLPESLALRAALNHLKLLNDSRFACAYISAEEMEEINADITDTDGISEYLLNITGVEVSLFLYEKVKNEVKASMRSLNINLSGIAKLFGGGGHKYASGCTIHGSIPAARDRLSAEILGAMGPV